MLGIDLGTTNSLVGGWDESKNEVVLYTGLMSSNVDLSEKKAVGRDVFGPTVMSSYKVNMTIGTDGELPVFCSSIILKTLVERVGRIRGYMDRDVCISVPAYFTTSQRMAVKQAADLVGLNLKRIVNEPTAAAIYACKDKKDLVLVYDLGGGTFDITLLDTRDGTYQTIATDGETIGGDNFDNSLVDYIIKKARIKMLYLTKEYRNKLLLTVRNAKEELQKTRQNVFVDITYSDQQELFELTVDAYVEVMKMVFTPTLMKTLSIIDRYVPIYEDPSIIYTGGSTYCPYLMEWLNQEFDVKLYEYATNRDMLVAHGIAYIAHLVGQGKDEMLITNVTKQLAIELDNGTCIPVIGENTVVPCSAQYPFTNLRKSDNITLRLFQGNNYMARDNEFIGSMEYNYGCEKEAGDGMINVEINVTYDGYVVVKAFSVDEDQTNSRQIRLKLN